MDSLRLFYTSLLRQNPKSELAIKWCILNGHTLYAKQVAHNPTFSHIYDCVSKWRKTKQKNKDLQEDYNMCLTIKKPKQKEKDKEKLKKKNDKNKKKQINTKKNVNFGKNKKGKQDTKEIENLHKKIGKLKL